MARPLLAQQLERDLGAGVEAALERDDVDRLGVGAEGLEGHRLLHVRAAQLSHAHVDRHLAALEVRPGSWSPSGSRRPSGRARRSCRSPTLRRGRRACAGGGCRAPGRGCAGRSAPRLLRSSAAGLIRSLTSTRWRTACSIPRAWGVSLTSTVWPMRRRPSERRVSSCLGLAPLRERRWVTVREAITPPGCPRAGPPAPARRRRRRQRGVGRLRPRRLHLGGLAADSALGRGAGASEAEDLVDRQPAQGPDLLGGAQAAQAGDGRLDEVDRVLGAEALGEDVVDPGELEHGAHAAAGDHAGAGGGGLQQDPPGAEYARSSGG